MEKILIGAHTSAAGGSHQALFEGQAIGATTIQLFTANQKQWNGRTITPEEVKLWQKALDQTGMQQVMSHDSYLINLGSCDPVILHKSRTAFRQEIERCHTLQIPLLNFHPGAATTATQEQCLATIVESLLEMEELILKGSTLLLLETTAGQGSSVGHRFEHLGTIIQQVAHRIPIGVCIDTCHIFVAGYDIRTEEGWNQTWKEFDTHIGRRYLHAFHFNDSMKELGSRVDRHAPLGQGKIGLDCFRYLMQHNNHPKYLETPNGPPSWIQEIATLKNYVKETENQRDLTRQTP